MLQLTADSWQRTARAGERLTFGRSGCGVDLPLADDPRLHRHCGTIVVLDDGWELHNTGGWLRLRVVSVERFGIDDLTPGEHVRVPWPMSRVQLFAGTRCVEFSAAFSAGASRAPGLSTVVVDGDGPTLTPVPVDRAAGYFRALVALCEPRLLDPASADVATDLQIALRLNRSGRETGRLSGKTVERRLDSCRTRFGLKETDERGMSAGLERRDARRLLVDLALLTGTVTVPDLRLIEPAGAMFGDGHGLEPTGS